MLVFSTFNSRALTRLVGCVLCCMLMTSIASCTDVPWCDGGNDDGEICQLLNPHLPDDEYDVFGIPSRYLIQYKHRLDASLKRNDGSHCPWATGWWGPNITDCERCMPDGCIRFIDVPQLCSDCYARVTTYNIIYPIGYVILAIFGLNVIVRSVRLYNIGHHSKSKSFNVLFLAVVVLVLSCISAPPPILACGDLIYGSHCKRTCIHSCLAMGLLTHPRLSFVSNCSIFCLYACAAVVWK